MVSLCRLGFSYCISFIVCFFYPNVFSLGSRLFSHCWFILISLLFFVFPSLFKSLCLLLCVFSFELFFTCLAGLLYLVVGSLIVMLFFRFSFLNFIFLFSVVFRFCCFPFILLCFRLLCFLLYLVVFPINCFVLYLGLCFSYCGFVVRIDFHFMCYSYSFSWILF